MDFDPNQFLDQETTTSSEKRPPLPVGDYLAIIGEVTVEPWAGKPGSKSEGKSGMMALIPLDYQVPPNIKQELGYTRDSLRFTDRVFLDLTEGGALDWSAGMNRGLRNYRIATGQNEAGEAFSLRRLSGRPVTARMEHELYKGETQERVGGVTKAK